MSVSGKRGVGIPVILLHDAEGGIVTIEIKNGFTYRGILDEAQDNMNCTMKECTKTDPDGRETRIEIAFIRGSQIKFVILPDMLHKAPFFNRIKMWRKYKGQHFFGGGLGGLAAGPARGVSAAIMQKSQQRIAETGQGRGDGGMAGQFAGGRGPGPAPYQPQGPMGYQPQQSPYGQPPIYIHIYT
mmetsp:Transcript_3804/g.3951  ORF Transcript_3804/g.3951 Transcript_3804/m.3951 type:complete len:185 (+) Transcript_3804:73-627(+)